MSMKDVSKTKSAGTPQGDGGANKGIDLLVAQILNKFGAFAETVFPLSELGLASLVDNKKIAVSVIENLVFSGFRQPDLELIIPARTLRDRKKKNKPLTRDEIDRTIRLMRTQILAEQTFANKDKADKWLHKPLTSLEGKTPMEMAATDVGARVVERILAKIAWGAAA